MNIWMLKVDDKLVTETLEWHVELPRLFRTKAAAMQAGYALANDPLISDRVVKVYQDGKGCVAEITPRFGLKHPYEQFYLFNRAFDITAAWNLIARTRKTQMIGIESIYKQFLDGNDVDLEDERNWEKIDEKGSRRLKKIALPLISIDIEKAMSDEVDYSIPLLVAPMLGGKTTSFMVIDGWHRLFKAYKVGIKELPAFVLSTAETRLVTLR